jgi:hypothetical protein
MPEADVEKRSSNPKAPKPVDGVVRYLLPSFGSLSLLAILGMLFASSFRFLRDSDTGWHIRNGELIWMNGAIPRSDPFSHTMPGRTWFAWEWLADVGMAALHHWRGLTGVVAGAFLTLLAGYAMLHRASVRRGAGPMAACLMTIFGAFAGVVHWLARPHLISIVMLLAWISMVESFRRRRSRWIWAVPILTALWANFHGAFFVTFVLLVVYAVGEWLEAASRSGWKSFWSREIGRTLGVYGAVAAFSGLASLATPYTYRLYGHLWGYLTDSELLASIQEFQSPDFHTLDGKLIEILLVLGAIAAVNTLRRGLFVETGLFLLWSHMTLQSERHVTLAAVTLCPIIALELTRLLTEAGEKVAGSRIPLSGVFRKVRAKYREFTAIQAQLNDALLYVAVAVFVIAAASTSAGRAGEKLFSGAFEKDRFPVEAANFLAGSPLPGAMYAHDQYGGYLIYRLFPSIKVFVDGRSDFYRKGGVLEEARKITLVKPEWQTTLDSRNVQWMVLRLNEPLALIAQMSGRWKSIYQDKTAQILIRTDAPAAREEAGETK